MTSPASDEAGCQFVSSHLPPVGSGSRIHTAFGGDFESGRINRYTRGKFTNKFSPSCGLRTPAPSGAGAPDTVLGATVLSDGNNFGAARARARIESWYIRTCFGTRTQGKVWMLDNTDVHFLT